MIQTKGNKPRKNKVIVSILKAISDKSASEFIDDISTNKLYDEMKPSKINKVIDL